MPAPDDVAADGDPQPQIAFGNAPPMARSRITKKPWSTAACQVASGTWFSLTVNRRLPSSRNRNCSAEVFVRSTITEYVWKLVWHPLQAPRPLPMPVVSLHGPPGSAPQWKVLESSDSALTSSMMSSSPMLGQFVAPTGRAAAPIAQNAGQ